MKEETKRRNIKGISDREKGDKGRQIEGEAR